MNARITLGATVLAILSLTGCVTQAQIDEQNKQRSAINVSPSQIQATKSESTVVLSKNGHEVMYIRRVYPGTEDMTPQQIAWSKQFGTYEDFQQSVAVEQGKVWVGTVVTLANGECTESTSSIEGVPTVPGEPEVKVVAKLVPCPTAQAN
ncbi:MULTISPECIES: hypothetical protein [Pseudomonas]|uniref:hypothetical protein n=1 Tax=Pseudomonas TaxID=286 RepID=UPI000C32358E|nr:MULTISPECIES: hypothetical protein [Pseudomonas]PWD01966.1 hypothetical protein CX658_18585 [Pseudomonas amygdali pv. lachrymans]WNZ87556.1 hypothetical protein QOM10_30180 [Pseudomonas sp. P108]